jgi:VIT family protein
MSEVKNKPRHVLDPIERISEVLFGLIMVLTITCSFSIAEAGQKEVRTMLFAVIGCNLAWGIVDGFMYLMARFSEQGQGILALRSIRKAVVPGEAYRIICDALPPLIASLISAEELESIRQKLQRMPELPDRARLARKDWIGALAVFLLVFLSTFPIVIPFIFIEDAGRALRISNAIALVMLFITGYAFGRYAGHRPWRTGLAMVVSGTALVGMTMALGG